MVSEFRSTGGRIDDLLYRPHRPENNCTRRKLWPSQLLQAAERWDP
jgi:histidinol phosphatase-like enzyme